MILTNFRNVLQQLIALIKVFSLLTQPEYKSENTCIISSTHVQ